MAWVADLLQGVPLSSVLKERVALAEDRARAIEEENRQLRDEVTAWKTKCEQLQRQLRSEAAAEACVKSGGVLWKKEADGQFEPAPYCPNCETPMHAFPPMGRGMLWICSPCQLKVNYRDPPPAT